MRRIRSQFALVFCLLAVLPLVVFGLVSYQMGARHVRQEYKARLTAQRDKKAALIQSWLEERRYDVRDLAGSKRIIDFLLDPSPDQLSAVRRRLELHVREEVAAGYQRIYVASAAGQILASTRPSDEGQVTRGGLEGLLRRAGEGDTFFSGVPGKALMDLAAPVAPQPGGRPIGAVVVEANLHKALAPTVLSREGLGETGEVILVNREGVALTGLRHESGGPGPLRLSVRAAPATAKAGASGLIRGKDYRGVPVVAAYATIPPVDWGLVVKQDQAELDGPVRELSWLLLAVVGGSTVVAAALAVWLGGRLTRPLRDLAGAARRLSQGEPGVRVEPKGAEELAATARAFNGMAAELEQARQEQERSRRRIEELARREEQRANWLATTLDQMPVGVAIARAPDVKIVLANKRAEEIWGMQTAYVEAGRYGEYWHHFWPDGRPVKDEELALARVVLRGEHVYHDEYVLERPDGSRVNMLVNAAPLAEDGKVVGGVAAFWDITAERETQRRLEEAGRLKDEFLSLASHELKTPIASIKIFSELAVRRPDAMQPKLMETLLRQADQLTALINDLLDVARLQLGRMPMEMKLLDLAGLVKEFCERQCSLLEQHVTLRLPKDIVPVEGDAARLEQVLSNLLDNAAKFSPPGSSIWVRVNHREDKAVIEVRDQGIGIPREHLPHIFERFYKPGRQQATYSGLGVGLYICKEFIERHGGRIWAESQEGKGSTFYVELPLAA